MYRSASTAFQAVSAKSSIPISTAMRGKISQDLQEGQCLNGVGSFCSASQPRPVLPSPRHLTALAPSSPIWRRTGHWWGCLLSPLPWAEGSATGQRSCSSRCLPRRHRYHHRLESCLAARYGPICSDTAGKPWESWWGCAAVSTPLLRHCLACHLNPTKAKRSLFMKRNVLAHTRQVYRAQRIYLPGNKAFMSLSHTGGLSEMFRSPPKKSCQKVQPYCKYWKTWGYSPSCENFKTRQFSANITFWNNLPSFLMGYHQLPLRLWYQESGKGNLNGLKG